LTMTKKEVEKRLSQAEKKVQRALEKNRLKWLQIVCQEAKENYGFGSLGEFIAFIFDHAKDIQLKEGE